MLMINKRDRSVILFNIYILLNIYFIIIIIAVIIIRVAKPTPSQAINILLLFYSRGNYRNQNVNIIHYT